MENITEIAFQIILHSGNSRSKAMEAIKIAKEENFTKVNQLMEQANEDINKAHDLQTKLLQSEAGGETTEISLILVHAQDHLMNAITVVDMSREIIELYKQKN